ncbi:hypothetical protein H0A36_02050 [Endozoicomonas sp. SM1973]|uniref:Uncharacterized protein n=1 Tax=Spartinivicinus marinus TaxID=2994442 RepID=A0A853I473_9GAMM|nr:hypothetical protein [Spartinivicinus marinus]MCX4029985.1 hypothetical protein [Spartinivicinus marinus]NYZ64771.1 hypothetical protein [Spartinivicinus marinus]
MADIHIDDFYHDCAHTLLRLYRVFPRSSTLYVDDIIGNYEPDEFGIPHDRHLACFGCMLWLGSEGYLRYQDTIRQDAIDQAVLTEMSFIRLAGLNLPKPDDPQLPPTIAEQQATLAQQLRNAVHTQSANNIKQVLKTFFTSSR